MKKFRMFDIHYSCLYQWKTYGVITFYLLPSIEFFRDNVNDDLDDYCFNISFNWLFWCVEFTKYWGMHIRKGVETTLLW